jgi:hydroxymethylglutaryl-CoA synthase
LAVYVPRLYVDLAAEWAHARAVDVGSTPAELVAKVTKGIGMRKIAVPDAHEDSATMAAMAALRLIDGLGLDPKRLGYLAVGTETTVDQSKSIAAYVQGMLSRHYRTDLSEIGCPQLQFACMGATYALESAMALLRSGELEDRYAIVVATDVARYALRGPAECTQGAGAVALCVSSNPRLLEFEARASQTVTLDERDFFRPNWSTEAIVDGQYSIDVYLECLDRVVRAAVARALRRNQSVTDVLAADFYLFHTPFPKMAEYAAARLFRKMTRLRDGVTTAESSATRERERELDRAVLKTDDFRAWFAACCAPGLLHAGDVGNLYSGSLYLCLGSLVEHLTERRVIGQAEKRLLMFSYGSGASAKLLSATLRPTFVETAGTVGLNRELDGRRSALSLADYERLHCGSVSGTQPRHLSVAPSVLSPANEFALLKYGVSTSVERVDLGYRYYDFVAPTG